MLTKPSMTPARFADFSVSQSSWKLSERLRYVCFSFYTLSVRKQPMLCPVIVWLSELSNLRADCRCPNAPYFGNHVRRFQEGGLNHICSTNSSAKSESGVAGVVGVFHRFMDHRISGMGKYTICRGRNSHALHTVVRGSAIMLRFYIAFVWIPMHTTLSVPEPLPLVWVGSGHDRVTRVFTLRACAQSKQSDINLFAFMR